MHKFFIIIALLNFQFAQADSAKLKDVTDLKFKCAASVVGWEFPLYSTVYASSAKEAVKLYAVCFTNGLYSFAKELKDITCESEQ
jgi:hypothetical protein